jgi:hypothetical protein
MEQISLENKNKQKKHENKDFWSCICNSTGKETVLIAGELGAFNCKLFMEA